MGNYRSKKLLDAARHAPACMACGKANQDDVVAAHSNQLRDGKGKGLKAHDYRIAYLCPACHHEIDQGGALSRDERLSLWEEAHRKTVGWLFDTERVVPR